MIAAAYLLVAAYFALAEAGSRVLPPPAPPALVQRTDVPVAAAPAAPPAEQPVAQR